MVERAPQARLYPKRDSCGRCHIGTNRTIGDVRQDKRFEYMSHVITIVVESRNTALLVIMYHLVDLGLLLKGG